MKRVAKPASVRRQQILDFLNEHGEATSRVIREKFELTKGPVSVLLGQMRDLGEIAAREERSGSACTPYYRALVTTIVGEENVQATTHPGAGKLKPYVVNLGAQNDGPSNNPRAGGQGALRQRTGVGSCAEWI